MLDWDVAAQAGGQDSGRREPIEIIGPHLRLSGEVHLGRFSRLSDFVNHSRGHVRVHNARLLRRNGDPTSLVVPELMVNQDEITFVAQAEARPSEARRAPGGGGDPWAGMPGRGGAAGGILGGGQGGPGGLTFAAGPGLAVDKVSRSFVIFTPGHVLTGNVHLHRDATLETFVDAGEPRFVPVTDATARSLADRRVVSRFALMLVNRTQMTAVADAGLSSGDLEAATDQGAGDHLAEG